MRTVSSSLGITVDDLGDRFVFGNEDGTFAVWKAHTTYEYGRVVGPGYLGKIRLRNGKLVCDGVIDPGLSANDPRWQGIGGFGCHHFRANGEADIWNRGWEMLPHRKANPVDPFGISSSSVPVAPFEVTSGADAGKVKAAFVVEWMDRYSNPWSLLTCRYDYIVEPSGVKMWVTVRQGTTLGFPAAFIKEPKLCVGLAPPATDGYRPHTLDVLRADGTMLRSVDLINEPKLQNPAVGTVQVGFDQRSRSRFYDGTDYFNIVARASGNLVFDPITSKVTDYWPTTRADWEGAATGLDKWAALANSREVFEMAPCSAYCLQGAGGTLTRQWEVAKRGPEPCVELMLHAWEGGSGLPDCLCCARRYVEGEVFTAFLSVSRDSGWSL